MTYLTSIALSPPDDTFLTFPKNYFSLTQATEFRLRGFFSLANHLPLGLSRLLV